MNIEVGRTTGFEGPSYRRARRQPAAEFDEFSGRELALQRLGAITGPDDFDEIGARNAAGIEELIARDVNCPRVSSAGRLFDAVAAVAGVCLESSYEGEAAMRLEDLARGDALGPDYELPLDCAPRPYLLGWKPLIARVWEDRRRGIPVEAIAARFHRGLAAAIAAMCARIRDDTGLPAVALSGGVFHNSVLTAMCVRLLRSRGFRVLEHRDFPPGDGGLSLGQALIADRKLAQ